MERKKTKKHPASIQQLQHLSNNTVNFQENKNNDLQIFGIDNIISSKCSFMRSKNKNIWTNKKRRDDLLEETKQNQQEKLLIQFIVRENEAAIIL